MEGSLKVVSDRTRLTSVEESWMSPMNRIRWYRAFKARATSVTIRDGRRFNIYYIEQNVGLEKTAVKLAVVKPVPGEGFVPCGKFRLEKVTDRAWVTASDIAEPTPSLYLRFLDEFIQSDLEGVRVDDHWPALLDKEKATLRRGFAAAKTTRGRHAAHVKVMTDNGKVYLVKERNAN